MISGAIRNVAVPQECLESVETRLLRGGNESEGTRSCPIALQEAGEIPSTPEGAADQSEDAGKAVIPSMSKGEEAQEHIDQQSRPYLPADSVCAVTQEIGQLEGLLDLLKEGFDGPAATVKVGDTGRTPHHVVCEENHFLFNPVNFYQSGDATHQFGVVGQGGDITQDDDLIAQDATCHWQGMKDFSGHVLLGAGDPEDTALEQIEEMGKVQISLVEDDNLTGANTGAEFTGAFAVIFPCGINNR